MEKTINMKIQRITLYAALAVLVIAGIILMTGRANAMNDRSVNGSIALPADRTITVSEGVETKINFGTNYDNTSYHYLRIKASKTGYIVFTNDYVHGDDVALCSANKRVLSVGSKSFDDFYSANSKYPYQTVLNYGVKKGKTYLIRIKGNSSEHNTYKDPYIGTVKWINKSVKAVKFGKSKKKAKTLKKGKKINGMFTAGNKKAQWYKIKSKKKRTNIYISAPKANGSIIGQVYYKSLGKWYSIKLRTFRSDSAYKRSGYIQAYNSRKNTYYVKVYPDYKVSGAYTLKWK